jgi:hypothetical protein
MKKLFLSSVMLLTLFAGMRPASAQYYYGDPPWIRPPTVRGTFGFGGFGTLVVAQSGGVEYLHNGGGLQFWGGVEIGRIFGIEVKYDASFHNPISDCGSRSYPWCGANYLTVETISLDLKLHIPTNSRFVPYFVVAPMVGWIGRAHSPTDAVGGGFEAGGGFDVWFSRHGTIGVECLYRGLKMQDFASSSGTDTYISFVQIGGNVAAHF